MFRFATSFSKVIARSGNSVSRHMSTGTILMKPTKKPEKTLAELGFDRDRKFDTGQTKITRSPMRTEDELFDENDPLSYDMLELEPHHPQGTVIWLLGLSDTHQKTRPLFECLRSPNVRLVVPNPPRIPITALADASERAWYDIPSNKYTEEDEEDYKGIKLSMYRLHTLIHEEADRLGAIHAPPGTDPLKARAIGAARIVIGGFGQGGALAMFSGIRYPHKLSAMVCFSGYFPHIDETLRAAQLAQEGKSLDDDGEEVDAPRASPNLLTPSLILHGQHDDAIPWAEFAKPRYLKACSPPLSMKMEVRASHLMGHYMGTNEMMGMHQWMKQKIEQTHQAQIKELADAKVADSSTVAEK